MKTYLYLSTAIISVSLAASGNTLAQCVSTQDCATLGYTETSCPNGGVKCPFGSKWFCASSEITPEQCTELGFTQTCTGTGYSGGTGKVCNGKYNYCSCTDGYVWNASSQKCEDPYANCVIGALYYIDGTCSDELESSKTLLGVVIYEKSASESGWIMAVEPIEKGIYWSTESKNIPLLPNYTSTPTDIQASCTNPNIITASGNSSTYPAAWAAKRYSPAPSGKSWCLPSGGLLNNINNSTNFAKVNAGITTAGGTMLGYGDEEIWSSSEANDGTDVWVFNAQQWNNSFSLSSTIWKGHYYCTDRTVRPVMEF